MAKRDAYHHAVRQALEREGWQITADPFRLIFGDLGLFVDLAAERTLGAERGGEQIAVEVKTFLGTSEVTDFYITLGQFLSYQMVMERSAPACRLFVAIPVNTWATFFRIPFAIEMCARYQLRIVVFNPNEEVPLQWIKS